LLARAKRVAAFETTPVWLNGAPAGRVEIDGQVAAVSLVVENGRVTRIYAVANPPGSTGRTRQVSSGRTAQLRIERPRRKRSEQKTTTTSAHSCPTSRT